MNTQELLKKDADKIEAATLADFRRACQKIRYADDHDQLDAGLRLMAIIIEQAGLNPCPPLHYSDLIKAGGLE